MYECILKNSDYTTYLHYNVKIHNYNHSIEYIQIILCIRYHSV